MTPQRDIESVLDRWFDEGPTQMPDRFFNAVVDHIDSIPQRRLAHLQTRLHAMNSNARLAAAAALIVAVAGAGALFLNRGTGTGVSPSASTPIASSAPSPTGGLLPAVIQQYWIGATRTVGGINPAPDFSGLRFSRSSLQFDAGSAGRGELFSKAELVAADRITFRIITPGDGCSTGDVGTYRFSVSPGGGFLTLTQDSDACAARAAAITGQWERSACPDPGHACLGDLEAGPHLSAHFNPRVPFSSWTYAYGRFRYTVPAGWANSEEGKTAYVISRQGAGEDAAIWLLSEQVAHAQADGCPENAAAAGIGRTPTALAAWLGRVPGLVTTKPATVTVGGLSGLMLDVSVAPSWTKSCPSSAGTPAIKLLADPNSGEEHDVDVQAGNPKRLLFLDLGDGRSLVILISAKDKTTWDALVPDAMSIIQTFTFPN